MCEVSELVKLCEFEPKLLSALQELQQLRNSKTESAKKYLTNYPWQQMEHIESENIEEKEAFELWMGNKGTREELGMELIDGQYTRQTMLEILFTESDIENLHNLVRKKNKNRNYHIKQQVLTSEINGSVELIKNN